METVKEFQTAALDRDGDRYCDLLTGDAKRNVIVDLAPLGLGFECPNVIEKAFRLMGKDDFERVRLARERLTVRDVKLTGTAASVRLASGKMLRLRRSGGIWLISKP